MDIVPEVYNYNKEIQEIDEKRIANLEELDKIHENTILYYYINADDAGKNINILEEFKHFHIHIEINSNNNFTISRTPLLDSLFISFGLRYFQDNSINNAIGIPKNMENKVIKILENLHEEILYLNLIQINYKIKVNQYLPRGLKEYTTIANFDDDLDNLPNSLKYLCVFLHNEDELINKYNFNFLPVTLHTLILNIHNHDYIIPELNNLPINLKNLDIDRYNHTLATLPSGLEKLIIYNYFNIADEHILPRNLKVLQMCNCNDLNIKEFPPQLKYLDIHMKVDLDKLPLSIKGVGLYNFNLEANTPEIPLNITSIYTNDKEIKQLPAHIKRVIIIRQDLGNIITARIGDVSFEMDTFNREEAFFNNKK
jgi:hypothetical protein